MAKAAFVPLYRKIYNDLKEKLLAGAYPPGSQLPFEQALCKSYGVERVTIRRALNLLVQDGLIEKRAGVGSFVTERESLVPQPCAAAGTILFAMQKNQNDIRHNATAFNALLYFVAEQACKDAGYSLLYVSVQPDENIRALAAQHDVSGIFLVSTVADTIMHSVLSMRIPAICINTYEKSLISILPDNIPGTQTAVEHLIRGGHKRIAFIGGTVGSINAEERFNGYQKALLANGISYDPMLVTSGHWTFDGGRAGLRMIMDNLPSGRRPSAVFAASDMMAIGAMDSAREMGLKVPEDLSVIGFDNVDMCNFCTPTLTSMSVDTRQMAGVAVEMMSLLIKRGLSERDRYIIRLPVDFIARNSEQALLGV